MADKKMTKREHFALLREVAESAGMDEQVAFIDRELELLSKKHAKSDSLTPDQVENERIKAAIASVLADSDAGMRAGEVGAAIGISNQKTTSLLTQMAKAGIAQRVENGKVVTFTL